MKIVTRLSILVVVIAIIVFAVMQEPITPAEPSNSKELQGPIAIQGPT
jgi:hypothetical protein